MTEFLVGGADRGEAGSVRALVIDDDPSIVRFLEIYLDGQGFQILSAHSGSEGVQQARTHLPDIVLLDYSMPDMDGMEVLQHLKSDSRTRPIPVVVLTARSEIVAKIKSLNLGVEDYITKPFDIRELRARLHSIIARRRQHAETTHAERLKTLRKVIASVSHEVNNPLTAILMCAESLEQSHAEAEDVVRKCRIIQTNTLRIRDILKRLERAKVTASKPYVAGEQILDLEEEEEET